MQCHSVCFSRLLHLCVSIPSHWMYLSLPDPSLSRQAHNNKWLYLYFSFVHSSIVRKPLYSFWTFSYPSSISIVSKPSYLDWDYESIIISNFRLVITVFESRSCYVTMLFGSSSECWKHSPIFYWFLRRFADLRNFRI